MDETIEVVICHDILEVPSHETTEYVWAATHTFTIKYLPDDDEGAGPINGDAAAANGKSDFSADCCGRPISDLSVDNVGIDQNSSETVAEHTNTPSSKKCTLETLKAFRHTSPNGKKKPNTNTNGMAVNTKALNEHFSLFDDNKAFEEPVNENTEKADPEPLESRQTYSCCVCEKLFQDKVLMHTHRIEHFGYVGFKDRWKLCLICQGKFHDLVEFSDHLLHQHYRVASVEHYRTRKRKRRPKNNQLHNEEINTSVSPSTSDDANKFQLLDAPETQKQHPRTYNNPEASLSPPVSNGSIVISTSHDLDKGLFYKNFPTTNNDRLAIHSSSVVSKCEMQSSNITSDTVPMYANL